MGAEREGIQVLKIGITMAVLAVLIIIATYGVFTGRDIGNAAVEKFENIDVETSLGGLKDLNDQDNLMPAASALSLFQYNRDHVGEVVCYFCDEDGLTRSALERFCLLDHLKGNVMIRVETDDNTGMYRLILRPVG